LTRILRHTDDAIRLRRPVRLPQAEIPVKTT
jgi:hypothetical protein